MIKKILFSIFLLTSLTACSSKKLISYYNDLNQYSLAQNYNNALTLIDKNENKIYKKKSRLLYYLDKGYFAHLAGDYSISNEAFKEAKKLYDDYFTKSVSNAAASMAVNDKIQPYYGETFEISMLYFFKILNYLKLNQAESAAVEARAVNHYLKTLTNNNWSKKVYKDDAFLQYITGLVYEINGETNNAFISYRKALYLYKNSRFFNIVAPQDLYDATINMGKQLGFNSEIRTLKKDFKKQAKNYTPKNKNSELIIFHYNGLVPHKIANTIEVSFNKAWANVNAYKSETQEDKDIETASRVANSIIASDQIIVSVPTFSNTPYNIYATELSIENQNIIMPPTTSLGHITLENFKDEKGKIYAKAMARSAIKFALIRATEEASQENLSDIAGFLIGAGLRTTASLTEDADIRSWRVIPAQINMARLKVDTGTYKLNLTFKTKSGFEKSKKIDIKIANGQKKFLILHTVA
ncbi:MAG: hypothetical protein GY830_02285 [Bacteroidetes bacterium]|nr:hypothetical protein [Bacteroidota bacterium]